MPEETTEQPPPQRLGFARAFTSAMTGRGKGGTKSHFVAAALAIVVFAGVAVAIGALTSHGGSGATAAANVTGTVQRSTASAVGSAASSVRSGTTVQPAQQLKDVPAGTRGALAPVSSASGSQQWPPLTPVGVAPPPQSSARSTQTAQHATTAPHATTTQQASAGQPGPARSQAPASSASRSSTQTAAAKAKSSSSPAPPPATTPTPSPSSGKWVIITGQVNCTSGARVEGFWIKATDGHRGWASWIYAKNPVNADYWMAVPPDVWQTGYRMSVGCGGSRNPWKVATYTPLVFGHHNSFHCDDQPKTADFGKCVLR